VDVRGVGAVPASTVLCLGGVSSDAAYMGLAHRARGKQRQIRRSIEELLEQFFFTARLEHSGICNPVSKASEEA